MPIKTREFGTTPDGRTAMLYELMCGDVTVAVTDFGASLVYVLAPDRNGMLADVALGFSSLDEYLTNGPYHGNTVGRVANRIAAGTFTLDGETYQLAVNNGPNSLHGGDVGFNKKLWTSHCGHGENDGDVGVKFRYTSPAGEENYPGELSVEVMYTLSKAGELRIDYTATADAPTICNLTNHTYWNLAGEASDSTVCDHVLQLHCDTYTPGVEMIPTGEIAPVEGPLDFRAPTRIGDLLPQLPVAEGDMPGYDHNFVVNRDGEGLAPAAKLTDPASGRTMEVLTTQPGIQVYTANWFDGGETGKGGVTYRQHYGVALETQHFPDSVNQPSFPTIVLRPGETYRHTTVFKFAVE
ncbi:MAG: galactose mutarotase [Phycisphaerales bacterium]|jgi:aldose 1-epimerase|nr:galactose mutarotase [Phycisphaerales bacterium]MBT7171217.1 galactose mutarotase [Phycisphaerales bacterium]